jgi:hypothetical protein
MDWRVQVRLAVALTFAAAAAYVVWRVEWFDVFRWGTPPPTLLAVYAGYAGAAGLLGWLLAALVTRRRAGRWWR